MDEQKKKRRALDWVALGLTVAAASALIPAVFPKEIIVSPLVLFGIVFLTNAAALLVPDDSANRAGVFGWAFFARLVLSLFFATLLVLIWVVARSLE
jgi:hypothetical protein